MNLWYGVLAMSYFFLYTELLIFSFEIIFMTGLKKLLNNLSSFLYKSLIALSCFLFGLDLVKNSFFFSQYLTICQLINSEPPSLSSPNSQNGNSFLISSTALTVAISPLPIKMACSDQPENISTISRELANSPLGSPPL